jgi:hypothetical protein
VGRADRLVTLQRDLEAANLLLTTAALRPSLVRDRSDVLRRLLQPPLASGVATA